MASMNRRGFLGLLGISIPTTLVLAKGGKSQAKKSEPKKTLKIDQCPKCTFPMYLPSVVVNKNSPSFHKYAEVPITCTCYKCGYSITEKVKCFVRPKIERKALKGGE